MPESITDILSGVGASAPAPEKIVDEPEAIVGADLETPEQTKLPDEPQEQPHPDPARQEERKNVPLAALQDERGKVKRYTEEVAEFRRAQAAQAAQIAQLTNLLEQRQQQQQEKPDWWTDPDAAISQRLGSELSPIQNQLAQMQNNFLRTNAIVEHGREKVTAFEEYVTEAMNRNDPEMAILSAQMRASQDPIATGLKWFEQRTFDPAAERERIKAELLAEVQAGQQPNPQQQNGQRQQPVMPTNMADVRSAGNRGGPGWSGPPSIEDALAEGRKRTIFK